MIIFNKKSGFSLAESIVSMMIMSLVILLTFAAITRKKTVPMNKTTISGVYACWKDASGNVHGEHFDGQFFNEDKSLQQPGSARGLQPESGYDCKFQMDRRADKYYVIAVGSRGDDRENAGCSGNNCIDGQLQQVMVDTPSSANNNEMFLNIKLGDARRGSGGNGGLTKVVKNDGEGTVIIESMGGVKKHEVKQNQIKDLVNGNIKSCKFVGEKISDVCGGDYSLTCTAGKTDENGSYLIRAGRNPYKSSIEIKCQKNKVVEKSCFVDVSDMTKYKEGVYIGGYKGICDLKNHINGEITENVEIPLKIAEYDSSFKATVNNDTKNSPFVHYLKMLPHNIQNGLTDKLLRYYQDSPDKKDGVVLIIW